MSYLPHDFEQDVARLRIDFADHAIRLTSNGDVKVYRIEKPGTLNYYVDFIFIPHPKRIIITGDLCLGIHGAISCGGYGFGWFCERLSDTYICEKFLRSEYDFESTKAALMYAWHETTYPINKGPEDRERLCERLRKYGYLDPGEKLTKARMEALVNDLEYDQARLYDLCCAFGFEGMQHVYKDAPALVVAQETFRRLIHELPAKEGGLKADVAP